MADSLFDSTSRPPIADSGIGPSAGSLPLTELAVGEVDLSHPGSFVDGVPHAYFRWLREHDPVHWQDECKLPGVLPGRGYWALTRHEHVSFVSKNAALFSSGIGSSLMSDLRPKDLVNMQEQLINMDPPGHTALRTLMNSHFKPKTVAETETDTRHIVQQALDAIVDAREFDFVEDYSAPISLRVLTRLIGVPNEHAKRFYRWTNLLIAATDGTRISEHRARYTVVKLFLYAAYLAWKRRKVPGDDIYSSLVHGEIDGEALDRLKLGMNFFLLVVAGNETTRNALSGGIQALCEHPDEFAKLRRDPSLLPSAIEEMLRWVTPVMQFRRTATRDTQIGEQPVAQGEKVVMYYGAANRDPRVFQDPERFDITRQPNPHLAFGTGTHFCVGNHLARLTMRIALEGLLERFPRLELAAPPQRLRSNFIAGITKMPMRAG